MKKYRTTCVILTKYGQVPQGTESISSNGNEAVFSFFNTIITFIIDDTNSYLFEEI
jgi:hypothetical protein